MAWPAVRPSRSPCGEQPLDLRRRTRRRTSRRPAERSARRASAGRWRRRSGRCGSAYSSRGRLAVNGRPVISTTSRARTIRRPLSTGSGRRPRDRPPPTARAGRPGRPRRARPRARGDRLVGAGELEPVQDGPRVERRPADEHRHPRARRAPRDAVAGPPWNCATVAGSSHIEQVEQVVGDAAPLGSGRLRGADVHAAIDRHRVGVDDLAVSRRASASARSLLPEAVAPTTATTG